ncbi:MAG: hypothetical protein WBA68_04535 [Alteraurantiacibacter sp.]
MARPYICVVDQEGNEIAGSRRYVDYDADRSRYFAARNELEAAMGETCRIFDSKFDRARED